MSTWSVICIDFQPRIPGREIAAKVARTLQQPLLDREIITRATAKLELPASIVVALEDEPDHRIERWLLAAAEGDQALGVTNGTTVKSDPLLQPRQPLMQAIRDAIEEIATRPCVIAEHHAAYALADRHDVLRILPCVDRARRQEWLVEQRPANPDDPVRSPHKQDRAERTYVRQAFRRPWPDPRIYQLIMDIGRLPVDCRARLVAEYVRSSRTNEAFAS